MKTISILIDTSDEAMVGSDGWGIYDAAASVREFIGDVRKAVMKEFPDCAISIEETNYTHRVEVDGDEDIDVKYDVDNIISDVFQSQSWYIEAELVTYTITIEEDRITVAPTIEGAPISAMRDGEIWTVVDGHESELYETVTQAAIAVRRMIDYYASEEHNNIDIAERWIADYPLNQVMTAAEVTVEFGLAEATVRQAINRDTLYARKSGETWLVLRKDAEARWGKKSH
jgi:hypothetical protein